MPQIFTTSGGLIETFRTSNILSGDKCLLHIDQSANIRNGEGEASVEMGLNEVKDLIAHLNDYIIFMEGKPYVVLAEPLLHPDVKIVVNNKEVEKIPELINQYLVIENVITPGEATIDYDNYFESVMGISTKFTETPEATKDNIDNVLEIEKRYRR